jgi:hypothetical protein
MRASHAPFGRVHQNPKFFLTTPFSAGGVGGAGKKWKGKFLVLVPPLQDSKKSVIYILSFCRSFLHPSRRQGAPPSPRLVVALASAHTSQSPRIGTLAFAHVACSVLASCSLCAFGDVRGGSKKADCAKLTNGTNKSYCACPTRPVRAQSPSATRTAPL